MSWCDVLCVWFERRSPVVHHFECGDLAGVGYGCVVECCFRLIMLVHSKYRYKFLNTFLCVYYTVILTTSFLHINELHYVPQKITNSTLCHYLDLLFKILKTSTKCIIFLANRRNELEWVTHLHPVTRHHTGADVRLVHRVQEHQQMTRLPHLLDPAQMN